MVGKRLHAHHISIRRNAACTSTARLPAARTVYLSWVNSQDAEFGSIHVNCMLIECWPIFRARSVCTHQTNKKQNHTRTTLVPGTRYGRKHGVHREDTALLAACLQVPFIDERNNTYEQVGVRTRWLFIKNTHNNNNKGKIQEEKQ